MYISKAKKYRDQGDGTAIAYDYYRLTKSYIDKDGKTKHRSVLCLGELPGFDKDERNRLAAMLTTMIEDGQSVMCDNRKLYEEAMSQYVKYRGSKIASCLRYDIRYMWICGGQRQSYSTINRFRTKHLLKCIDFYFDKVVNILVEKGVITLEEQYVDGTKIESKANKYTFVWKRMLLTRQIFIIIRRKTTWFVLWGNIWKNVGSDRLLVIPDMFPS